MSEIKYQIEQKKSIDSEELASFSILYAPLLKPLSYQFYLLMSGLLESHGRIKNNRFFCETLHCTPLELTQAREELETFMLLKTYESDDKKSLILQLQPIKRGFKFLNHEVLGRYYLMKMGTKAYQFAQLCFKDPALSLDGYSNISQTFDPQVMSDYSMNQENDFQTNRFRAEPKTGSFDINKFLKKCSKLVFPSDQRNKENLQVIEDMGNYYKVSMDDMISFVGKAIPNKTMVFNPEKFKELVRKKYLPLQKENDEPYRMNPVAFLQRLQNGVQPSQVDARLLEELTTNFKLKDDVINIMIEYILKTNDNRLDRNYVTKIASVWVRNNIDTKEKALEAIKPQQKKTKSTKKTERTLPNWYINEEDEFEQASDESIEEFERMIGELK